MAQKKIKDQMEAAGRKWAKENAAGDERVFDAWCAAARWWNKNAQKSTAQYVKDIEAAIIDREGKVKPFLQLQIHKTARLWQMRDRLAAELDMEDSFMMFGIGSTKQMTQTIDPRLTSLEKLERTLTSDLAALGLNYNANPTRIRENAKRGADDEKDELKSLIDAAKNNVADIPDID